MTDPSDPAIDPASVTLAEILAFYERRGYGHRLGFGRRPAVIVIDFSNAFTRGTPGFATVSYDREIERTGALLKAARRSGAPVLFTTIAYGADMRDAGLWAEKVPWLAELKDGSEAVAIDDRVAARPGEAVIVKKYPSAFFGTDLEADLRRAGVDTLVIAGCTMSVCVRATAIDAMQRGFRAVLARDAIGELNGALHALHLADIRARYADVATVAELVPLFEAAAEAAPAGRPD